MVLRRSTLLGATVFDGATPRRLCVDADGAAAGLAACRLRNQAAS